MAAPVSGMTGFARAQRAGDFGSVTIEARSVNARGLDARLRTPAVLDHLEAELRNRVKARFSRGAVTVNVTFEEPAGADSLHLDEARLRALAEAGRKLAHEGLAEPPRADGLLGLRGVIVSEDAAPDPERAAELDAATLAALDEALDGLEAARREEGAALAGVIEGQVAEIEALRERAAAHAASQPAAIRDRIKAKFDELLPSGLDEDRLAQEAAALAVRADVREELDRLAAHVEAARALLSGGSPCGRKLDFLSQEFNREANTLCSKSTDRELTDLGLGLKAVIDQMREQVQNVE
ncbi:YicC family protein [Marinicauda salina]|uniref:YicC family protein n=1 Tax=Marinicauda salina TaxID=2135793 RepID=A0A2U2BTK8_9PROT|nr:YicC/YloC family endoribonuclease [Marinicauda salina]PWE17347.1 YicC family protein [Marinicauda salina]